MGQIVKQVSNSSTRYYWYPGDKREWLRGVLAVALGVAAFAIIRQVTHGTLLAAVAGTSVAAAIAGLNFGRRDSRELARFAELAKSKPARRQTAVHTGRAMWRGLAEGTGGAAAAVLIVNLGQRGVVADWLLPLVPAVVGALAHQIGGMYEHLATSKAIEGPAKKSTASATGRVSRAPARVNGTATATGRIATAPVLSAGHVGAGSVEAHSARAGAGDGAAKPGVRSTITTKALVYRASPLYAPVALPPNVSKVLHGKPPMPLSAAISARMEAARILAALGDAAQANEH